MRRWEDDIKVYVKIGWWLVEWIDATQILLWNGGILWTRYWTFGFHKMRGHQLFAFSKESFFQEVVHYLAG